MTLIQLNRAIANREALAELDQRRAAFADSYTNIYKIDANTFARHKQEVADSLAADRAALVAEFLAL